MLFSFSQWIHLEAKDHDLEFVQTVLYFSTQILQRSDAKRAHRASSVCSNPSSSGRRINGCRSESNIFSIQPKKLSEVRKISLSCLIIAIVNTRYSLIVISLSLFQYTLGRCKKINEKKLFSIQRVNGGG